MTAETYWILIYRLYKTVQFVMGHQSCDTTDGENISAKVWVRLLQVCQALAVKLEYMCVLSEVYHHW